LPRYDEVVDFSPPGWLDIYDDAVSRASFDLLEPLEDVRILDLACRHGRMSREIARRCAGVVGRDLSEKRIDKARAIDAIEPLDISYLNGDAAGPSILPGQAFDGVVSSFGLSDIDDLDGALATVGRVLAPTGRFVFSCLHPCFGRGKDVTGYRPCTGSYHDDGWWVADGAFSSLRRQAGANRRTLPTSINMLRYDGLGIDQIAEPRPVGEWCVQPSDAAGLPVYLVAWTVHL
jgi:SAM-dependent methyltransferase